MVSTLNNEKTNGDGTENDAHASVGEKEVDEEKEVIAAPRIDSDEDKDDKREEEERYGKEKAANTPNTFQDEKEKEGYDSEEGEYDSEEEEGEYDEYDEDAAYESKLNGNYILQKSDFTDLQVRKSMQVPGDDDSVESEASDGLSLFDSMDIQADFEVWEMFRRRMSQEEFLDETDERKRIEEEYRAKWDSRVERKEVYSKKYVPSADEKKELIDLEFFLGVTEKPRTSGSPFSASLLPSEHDPEPILLKRGPVLLEIDKGESESHSFSNEEKELILLTTGFIIAKLHTNDEDNDEEEKDNTDSNRNKPKKRGFFKLKKKPKKPTKKKKKEKVIQRKFELCENLVSISTVVDLCFRPSSKETYLDNCFSIEVFDKTYVLLCATMQVKDAWIRALSSAVTEAHARNTRGVKKKLGWQHDIMKTSLHSAAASGDVTMLGKVISMSKIMGSNHVDDINALDRYGHAALHYAAMREHVKCVEKLIDSGGDPNVVDMYNRVPMEYAEEKGAECAEILRQHIGPFYRVRATANKTSAFVRSTLPIGASDEDPDDIPDSGKNAGLLTRFRRHSGPDEITTSASHEASASATNAMSEAMSALQERGEKMEEVENKASQLKDAAGEYNDMAKQLKEKMEKKNKSIFPF